MKTWHPEATKVAERVIELLSRRAQFPDDPSIVVAPLPTAEDVAETVDIAFWGSMRREEGETPTISLAFVRPDALDAPLQFQKKIVFSAISLARLAPAVRRPGIHLGIKRSRGTLALWGTTRHIPPYCLVLEVSDAGLLVLKYRQETERAKYVNLAVIEGDRLKMVAQSDGIEAGCTTPLTEQFGLDEATNPWRGIGDILVELAVSMRALRHGGTLLVVPAEHDEWRTSLVSTLPYAVKPAYTALGDLLGAPRPGRLDEIGVETLHPLIDTIAGLTAVDGATVLRGGSEVVAFGAKIVRRRGSEQVQRVLLSEPIEGNQATIVSTSQLGGTRHYSAAQFVHDQRDSLALVASQDGQFTVFSWDESEGMVGARR
ncbi:MAG: putative sensor domain DACNV-containing protein, partial [Gemmatimonadaceae bacterium]